MYAESFESNYCYISRSYRGVHSIWNKLLNLAIRSVKYGPLIWPIICAYWLRDIIMFVPDFNVHICLSQNVMNYWEWHTHKKQIQATISQFFRCKDHSSSMFVTNFNEFKSVHYKTIKIRVHNWMKRTESKKKSTKNEKHCLKTVKPMQYCISSETKLKIDLCEHARRHEFT